MLDDPIRPVKERLLQPLARGLSPWVSATTLTLLALGANVGAAALAWMGAFGGALGLWFLSRILDGVDGVVSRLRGEATDLGGYLDSVLDAVGYAAIPLGIALHMGTLEGWQAVAWLLASFYLNSLSWSVLATLEVKRAGGRVEGWTSTPLPRGLVEGTETVILYALLLALPHLAIPLMIVMAGLVFLTALIRILSAIRRLA
jgi:phosphatidylserine synthase